jgi:hypothetical protein
MAPTRRGHVQPQAEEFTIAELHGDGRLCRARANRPSAPRPGYTATKADYPVIDMKASKALSRKAGADISKISSFAHWAIWGVSALIAIAFASQTLKDIPFGAVLSNANHVYLQAIILSFYIWCWAIGTSIDTDIQRAVYQLDPFGGSVRTGAIAAIAALASISIILLVARSNELYFALALAAFTAVDVLTWLYLRRKFLPPIVDATRKIYQRDRDYFGLSRLSLVVSQIAGNWKWWRQLCMSAIILLMIVVAIFPKAGDVVAGWGETMLSLPASTTRPLLQDLLLVSFLLVSEAWHFFLRLKTFMAIRLIDQLEAQYRLEPRHKS